MKYIIFLLIIQVSFGQYTHVTVQKCITHRFSGLVQVECNTISFENKDIPEDTTHLIIKCTNESSSSNISPLSRLKVLVFFSLSLCSIKSIESNMLQNLSNLKMVHLDQLDIEMLPENMFKNTSNIESFHLSYLTNLTTISPFTLNEELKIKEIRLVNLLIVSEKMLPFLMMTYKTLEILSWSNSVEKLTLNPFFFGNFNLKDLKLSRNQIKDFHFLENTPAENINLDYNNLGSGQSSFKGLSNLTIELYLGHNGIKGVFLQNFLGSATNVKVLYINNNEIIGLTKKFQNIFPKLEFLDASYNRIIQITYSFNNLFLSSFINLIGNPLFCGCNMNFLLKYKNKIKYKLFCTTITQSNDTGLNLSNSITNLSKVSEFMCSPPIINIWMNNRGHMVDTNGKESGKEATIISLYQCEYLLIKCIVKGDPLPQLKIMNPNEVIVSPAMLQHINPVTVSSPLLVISHFSLSRNSENNYFKCSGVNYFGEKEQIIYFHKKAGMRPKYEKRGGIMLSYLCLKREGLILQCHFILFIIFIHFFIVNKLF